MSGKKIEEKNLGEVKQGDSTLRIFAKWIGEHLLHSIWIQIKKLFARLDELNHRMKMLEARVDNLQDENRYFRAELDRDDNQIERLQGKARRVEKKNLEDRFGKISTPEEKEAYELLKVMEEAMKKDTEL